MGKKYRIWKETQAFKVNSLYTGAKVIQWRKGILFNKLCGTTGYPHRKTIHINQPLPHTIYKH